MGEFDEINAAWGDTAPAAQGANFREPIPAKTRVKVVVIDQKAKRVGVKGTPTCKVTCEVIEPEQYEGRYVWHDFWVTKANLPYLKRDLLTLGWKGAKVSDLMEEQDASLIGLGVELELDVERRKYVKDGAEVERDFNVVRFFAGPYTPPVRSEGDPGDIPDSPTEPPF